MRRLPNPTYMIRSDPLVNLREPNSSSKKISFETSTCSFAYMYIRDARKKSYDIQVREFFRFANVASLRIYILELGVVLNRVALAIHKITKGGLTKMSPFSFPSILIYVFKMFKMCSRAFSRIYRHVDRSK